MARVDTYAHAPAERLNGRIGSGIWSIVTVAVAVVLASLLVLHASAGLNDPPPETTQVQLVSSS